MTLYISYKQVAWLHVTTVAVNYDLHYSSCYQLQGDDAACVGSCNCMDAQHVNYCDCQIIVLLKEEI